MSQQLNEKQAAFVREYAIDSNATQAAIRAGYSEKTAYSQGSRLLKRVEVKAALQARGQAALAKIEVTEERTMQELAAVAFSNIKDYLEWDKDGDLVVKSSADIPDALAAAIESVEEQVIESKNKDGSRIYIRTKRKIKLYPKLPALQLISEYQGLTDSMAPKVTVHLITGIDRTPPAIDVTPEPVTVEAEAVVENPPDNRAPESP